MPQPPTLASHDAYLEALEDPGQTLRERYKGDPVALAERFGLMLPRKPVTIMLELGVITEEEAREKFGPTEPGLRELVVEVCMGEVEGAVAVGPRGGGKSQGVSFIEFYLWMIELYDALNLGGSELQANNVYEYLLGYLNSDPYWSTLLKDSPKVSETYTIENAWIRVLTASQKSVRSPHAGGVKRDGRVAGGLLVIDEEAEADPDIVSAALPTINTARPSVNVRCSTFHNAEGSFAEVVDDHVEMGYKLYRWDIFDICAGCSCTGPTCESDEKCFREDHYEEFEDPDTGETKKKLVHRAYCGGRAKYAEGWAPYAEIVKLWKRMKRNHSKFEVEAMGSRPSTKGHVIKDINQFNKNITLETGRALYLPGFPVYITVDWGAVAAGVTVWQEQVMPGVGELHIPIHADLVEEAGVTQILGIITGYWNQYKECEEVAADIGGGGNYLNPKLRDEEGIPCRDVNFAEEKESAVAAWNILNEGGNCMYPSEHEEFIKQGRNWKRNSTGRIAKGNDHLMDASICYFSRLAERLGTTGIRIPGSAFSTQVRGPEDKARSHESSESTSSKGRIPVAVGVGQGRRH